MKNCQWFASEVDAIECAISTIGRRETQGMASAVRPFFLANSLSSGLLSI